jgi:putative endonuclease
MARLREDSKAADASSAARRRQLGVRGEDAAARWYRQAGYDIVARNWRGPAGEIDLVALAPGASVVVVCEVKTRSSVAFGWPQEAVTPPKQRRLRHLATSWLAQERASGTSLRSVRSVRFDVAAVLADRCGALVVDVIEDAF